MYCGGKGDECGECGENMILRPWSNLSVAKSVAELCR